MEDTLLNTENKVAFRAWVEATGIRLVQVNGQRKYGGPPPGWTGPPPSSGSEVFISRLPQDLYEDKLIPLFQSAGQLYEFRLMMTFSGENRSFAYARYASRWHAQCAINMFNGYQIENGCPITVCRSTEKNELYMGGIPNGRQRVAVISVLRELTSGVADVTLCPETSRTMYAVVKYEDHRSAALAKKNLVQSCIELWGHAIEVDWMKSDNKQRRSRMVRAETQLPSPLLPQPASSLVVSAPALDNTKFSLPNIDQVSSDYSPVNPNSNTIGLPAYFNGTVNVMLYDLVANRDLPKQKAAQEVLQHLGRSENIDAFQVI
ncbi:dead end protein homolog 1 [Callorhinchus milii]|uniref:dead end protein homolog 1 n=1 Tax=Callorhinchus milii TaxID=7868 RepID=UPI001C3F8462|nr:dead end protein homolog 1 [Callorhinchus milii]